MTSTTPSFEVQLFRKGQWEPESRYDDPDVAEAAARALLKADSHIEGVRVTREVFDEKTKRFNTTVVFRRMYGELEELDGAREARDAERRAERMRKKAEAARTALIESRKQRGAWMRNPRFRLWLSVASASVAVVVTVVLVLLHFR
jgi:hypothetical protein